MAYKLRATLVIALQTFIQAPGDAVCAVGRKLFATVERGAEARARVVYKVLATISVGTLVEAFFSAAKRTGTLIQFATFILQNFSKITLQRRDFRG